MFERFDDRARRVLVLAQEEARLLEHPSIGTEHILLGLVAEGRGTAARALSDVDLLRARAVVQALDVSPGVPSPSPAFTPGAKHLLEGALRICLAREDTTIGTEHLLLSLLDMGEGPASRTLSALDIEPDHVRRRLENVLAGHDPEENH
jgi:ATP-dependent Clp protease ATP-binding subunit ClpC